MSELRNAAAKLVRGAIDNLSEDLLQAALESEQIDPSDYNVTELGRLLDEIDCDEAAGEAEQRLLALEDEEEQSWN
jgi:hypothetical protein